MFEFTEQKCIICHNERDCIEKRGHQHYFCLDYLLENYKQNHITECCYCHKKII
jgi:hypothetical protein